jgi:hypothetical protein
MANVLYAGTFGRGVLYSDDFAFSWKETPDNAMLPVNGAGHVFDLVFAEDASGVPSAWHLFAATGQGVWRQEVTAVSPTWTNADPTMAGSLRPEVRGLSLGDDMTGDGEPDLYAATWGFGAYRMATPFTSSSITPFALRSGNVTAVAAEPEGMVYLSTESGGLTVIDPTMVATDLAFDVEIPEEYHLDAAYPNPFNPQTTIKYGLPVTGPVQLVVYDMLGRQVATLVDEVQQAAGTYRVTFDAGRLSSGVYLYRIEAGGYSHTRTLTLVK